VIFCIYNKQDERRPRAKIDEFKLVSRQTRHVWIVFDLTDTFTRWLAVQRYARKCLQESHLLLLFLPWYLSFINQEFTSFLQEKAVDEQAVVALKGVGSLFGLLGVVYNLAPLINGRLLVFPPGSYKQNNYKLLDAYDGWNYFVIPIAVE
jgi:hypothetical protein